MGMRTASTIPFFFKSAFLHGAAYVAMAAVPGVTMIPAGTVPATVEIVPLDPPKGQQVKTMDVEPLSQPSPAPVAPAPKVPKTEIANADEMKVKLTPKPKKKAKVVRNKPKLKKVAALAPKKAEKKSFDQKDGNLATKAQDDKVLKELQELKHQLKKAEIERVAQKEQEELLKKQLKEEQDRALRAALEEERQRLADEKAAEELQRQQELEERLAAQEEKRKAEQAALAAKLAEQQKQYENALAEAKAKLNEQGKSLDALSEKNSKLAQQNQGMSRQLKENLAYGLPSGTRDYRLLRQVPGNVPPNYPFQDRLKGNQGKVLLHYYVTPNGQVASARIAKSSGYASLDKEALMAIQRFKFVPGQQGSTKQWVQFSLVGEAKSLTGGLKR